MILVGVSNQFYLIIIISRFIHISSCVMCQCWYPLILVLSCFRRQASLYQQLLLMNYGGKVCTILNNVLQKVTILLLTMFTILPEPHQKSGRTLIIYCTFCKYVIVICRSYTSRPTCYYVLVFFILHHDVRMYDFLWAYSA